MPLTPIQYQGCFDASAQNAFLSQATFPSIPTPLVALTGVAFSVFNTAAVVNILPSTAPAGVYRVTVYLTVTTTFVTNTTETITIGWTDDGGTAQTFTPAGAGLPVGTTGTSSGTVVFRSNGTAAITYKPAVTGTAATAGAASIYVAIERVG